MVLYQKTFGRALIGGALITDAPTLTFQELVHGRFWEFASGHQGPLPFGELSVACRAAQPFDVLVRPCPRPMRDVAFAGTIELRTLWIRAREASISLLDWRRQCHSGPPLSRIGPKDIDSTPVFPRYYSPGLPKNIYCRKLIEKSLMADVWADRKLLLGKQYCLF